MNIASAAAALPVIAIEVPIALRDEEAAVGADGAGKAKRCGRFDGAFLGGLRLRRRQGFGTP